VKFFFASRGAASAALAMVFFPRFITFHIFLLADYVHCLVSGSVCDVNIDECALMEPCFNNATCVDLINSYRCECIEGFSGRSESDRLIAAVVGVRMLSFQDNGTIETDKTRYDPSQV
jgi:EGF-like domain